MSVMDQNDVTRISSAELRVQDLDRVSAFYERIVGLEREGHTFKAPDTDGTLLRLSPSVLARRPVHPRAGLFHLAFLYSDRAGLAAAIHRTLEAEILPHGFQDHGVSEAFYLSDPEGNGIELYHDRPPSQWPRAGSQLAMGSETIDLQHWLDQTAGTSSGGITLGHVHLRVASLAESEAFYRDRLGMDVTQATYPGARFLSFDDYHHHVAINTWSGEGLASRKYDETGLIGFSFSSRPGISGTYHDPNGIAVHFQE